MSEIENCTHDCSSCGENCPSRNGGAPTSFIEKPHEMSSIRKVIGVVSGKGGVGKSMVTSMLAVLANRRGYNSAVLDADVTGPSIPKAFGIHERATGGEWGMFPARSKMGIEVMSVNMLLENETDPVIWRGPVSSGVVQQFWTDVLWNCDYLFVDMPPGTGDVPLTAFQSLPIEGIVIVTSPQDLVKMIVKKAFNMAEMMKIPVLGIVENYSYVKCPDCGKEIKVFGESHIDEIAAELKVPVLGKMPIDMDYATKADGGFFAAIDNQYITDALAVMPK